MLAFYIIMGATVLPLLIAASFLLRGKGAWMISGFNRMPVAKRILFDDRKLCRFVGVVLLRMSFFMGLITLGAALEIHAILWVGFGLTMLDGAYITIQMVFNKKRFLK